ncbi:hypothetical protein A2U01_0088641, partial [Trifolium medium]|nr:hypothetical protein [Trifolium medium]
MERWEFRDLKGLEQASDWNREVEASSFEKFGEQ